jgi:hypothetical protein
MPLPTGTPRQPALTGRTGRKSRKAIWILLFLAAGAAAGSGAESAGDPNHRHAVEGTAPDVHAGGPQQKLTVYVRDMANVHPEVYIPAKALASQMFAKFGISLDWRKGAPTGESSQPPIFIELVTETPENLKPDALAFALAYEGSHVTVFVDRIENRSYPSRVLAHVMVHEITHLLQDSEGHSAVGVMKARWTVTDFETMQFRPLPFTPEDVDLIYAGMAKRGGTGALAGRR